MQTHNDKKQLVTITLDHIVRVSAPHAPQALGIVIYVPSRGPRYQLKHVIVLFPVVHPPVEKEVRAPMYWVEAGDCTILQGATGIKLNQPRYPERVPS